jgi:NAD(P)-dependent dehydrogenase (short-subunit alcohol dehydrogenase family)
LSKTVLITGASRGIGNLAARRIAADGHSVVASMRDVNGRNRSVSKELTQWADAEGFDLQVVELDVTDQDSVDRAVSSIEKHQEIDVLVNNAGIMPVGVTEAFAEEQWRDCMEVNLYGVLKTTRAVLPHMRKRRRGALIHISSTAGRLAIPFFGVYCASKWAMEAFCETLHYEIEDFGIRSVIIEPSGHATDLVKTAPEPSEIGRKAAYEHLSDGGERMLGMFDAMFAEGDAITNAANVADEVASLVQKNGEWPMRVCVGGDMGVASINQCTAGPQAALIESLKPVYEGH